MDVKLHKHLSEEHGIDGASMAHMTEQDMIKLHKEKHAEKNEDAPDLLIRVLRWMAEQDKDGTHAFFEMHRLEGEWMASAGISFNDMEDAPEDEGWVKAVSYGRSRESAADALRVILEEFRIA